MAKKFKTQNIKTDQILIELIYNDIKKKKNPKNHPPNMTIFDKVFEL